MFHALARVQATPEAAEDRARRVAETFGYGLALRGNRPEPCCICLEPMLKSEVALTLPCTHIFHEHCIHEWLGRKAFCPLCKADVG